MVAHLRTRDNPALAAAARWRVLPAFVLDDVTPGPQWRGGGASLWWLHHSLLALRDNLGHLPLLRGDPGELLPAIIKKVGASAVYWNRCYEPFAIARDSELKASLQSLGVEVQSFNGSLLHEPWEVETGGSAACKVYSAYWRASLSRPVAAPLPAPMLKIGRSAARLARDVTAFTASSLGRNFASANLGPHGVGI
jgi:deoxyribodipyrimidine photo-lyase